MTIKRRATGRRLCLALAISTLLTGCVVAGSSRVRCPVLIAYPEPWQTAAAYELAALPADSRVAVLVRDYGFMRNQCRAIGARR